MEYGSGPGAGQSVVNALSYETYFELGAKGMLFVTPEGTVLNASREARRVLGWKRDEIVGVTGVFDGTDPCWESARQEWRSTGTFEGELRMLRRDGTAFPAEVSIRGYRDDAGGEVMCVVFRDLTGRMKAEEKLRFLSLVAENSLDGIYVADAERTVRFIVPRKQGRTLLGYSIDERRGISIGIDRHPDDAEKAIAWWERVLSKPGACPEHLVARYRHKDGPWRHLESYANNMLDDPDVRGVVISARDVTERERAQQRERFLSLLTENSTDQVNVIDADGTFIYRSPLSDRMTGRSDEEVIGKKLSDFRHPDDAERADKWWEGVFSKPGIHPEPFVARYRNADGIWGYRESYANNMLDDPDVRGVVLNTRDITERVRLEEALRESEERYRSLVELSPEAVLVHGDGTLLYVNAAGVRLLGAASADELVGKRILDFVHPDYRETVEARIARVQGGKEPAPIIEEKLVRLDGGHVDVEATGMPISYEDKPAVLSLVRDVTERERARERERFLSLLTENSTDMIHVFDADGTIRYREPSSRRMLGRSAEDAIGKKSADFRDPD